MIIHAQLSKFIFYERFLDINYNVDNYSLKLSNTNLQILDLYTVEFWAIPLKFLRKSAKFVGVKNDQSISLLSRTFITIENVH